eukprot:CAMPEP_0114316536 /NCGR_PEP_ID=MMETSP0059-20121206/23268_1 /TAXON_ID=36894 /ORGANISM="Pyramimonas parkeae, Strain CCMP726" /LENGTH=56 /DNA_ID=CAMNT_0001442499 /DNA_START=588 /DNA_END=758 /DNA_ORIENTATION=+
MVFNRKLEVRKGNGDECRHNEQYDKHNEKDGVDGVHLVAPDRGEDVVQLDVYRRER